MVSVRWQGNLLTRLFNAYTVSGMVSENTTTATDLGQASSGICTPYNRPLYPSLTGQQISQSQGTNNGL
jgi:hypothetical protein